MTTTGKQLFSTLESDGTLTVEVAEVEFPEPTGDQVLIKLEAAPINPSDLAILAGAADLENADYTAGKFVARMPEPFNTGSKNRHGQRLEAGNEGAGTVVAAGDGEAAQSLVGQRVACRPGAAFSQYVVADAQMCLPLGEHSAEEGASSFVNPMTVLSFVETVKIDGHNAMIHLAAASNLGQMLNRVCMEDGIELVNVVRKEEQVKILKDLGAEYIVNSSDDDFMDQLVKAIDATDAFVGFDPIGGGKMTDACLTAMERVAASRMDEYSRYGSTQDKKMHIYGRLDLSPTVLSPSYGLQWDLSGWLLPNFLAKAGMETFARLRQRVADNLTTLFASSYKRKVNLEQMLEKEAVLDYRAMRTGEKYLVTPWAE